MTSDDISHVPILLGAQNVMYSRDCATATSSAYLLVGTGFNSSYRLKVSVDRYGYTQTYLLGPVPVTGVRYNSLL